MRIFRLFCGTFQEPCQRNQNLIYGLFFGQGDSADDRPVSDSCIGVGKNKVP
jgi:hypothetical protein